MTHPSEKRSKLKRPGAAEAAGGLAEVDLVGEGDDQGEEEADDGDERAAVHRDVPGAAVGTPIQSCPQISDIPGPPLICPRIKM